MAIDPNVYARWRASPLGAITERLEQEAILGAAGNLHGRSVLDAGCGDGAYAILAWTQGTRVTGVDISGAMLQAAGRRAGARGAPIDFVQASIEHLPFETGTFDAVIMVTVLCVVNDRARAIKEAVRVLRPGGRLIIGELGRHSLWAFVRGLRSRLGNSFWRETRFWTDRELRGLTAQHGLRPESVRGSVYYPPMGLLARPLWPAERALRELGTFGAAFLTVRADKV